MSDCKRECGEYGGPGCYDCAREAGRQRDNLRRWLRRWRDKGCENGYVAFESSELDDALEGEKPPKGGRR